jgi:hypothetical protein
MSSHIASLFRTACAAKTKQLLVRLRQNSGEVKRKTHATLTHVKHHYVDHAMLKHGVGGPGKAGRFI